MNIIEMLMENPLIVFVIMGILSTIFSKVKNTQENQKTHERTPPKRSVTRQQTTSPREQTSSIDTYTPPVEVTESTNTITSEANEMLQRAERIEKSKGKVIDLDDPIKRGAIDKRDLTKQHQILDPKPKNILQGFIWAEVLAPPKSKRKSNI